MFIYLTVCFSLKQLGGINSFLNIERSQAIPLVSNTPTIILGMDVSHGSPGQSDIPSIAAVYLLTNALVFFLALQLNPWLFPSLIYNI